MHLSSTNTNGKKVTHVHDGSGHFLCGMADDIDSLDQVVHKRPTCKHCIKVIKDTVAIAKKYGIK